MKALDTHRRVTAVPYQKPGFSASVGISVEECKATVWAVAPDGRRYRGAEACNAVLAVVLGLRAPLLLYALPGVRQLQDLIYAFIAANRHWLPLPKDRPHCKQYPDECRGAPTNT